MKGKFIVIEGCDFTGKSTVIQRLVETLNIQGVESVQSKALGETHYGMILRKFLMENKQALTNEVQAFTMIDAMQEMNKNKLRFQQQDGVFVVCDRYYHSTLVYQGVLKNALEMVEEQLSEANLIEPDFTFILDCDTSVILERMKSRAETNSYDPKSAEEVEEIRNAYLKVAQRKNTILVEVGGKTIDEICEKILSYCV